MAAPASPHLPTSDGGATARRSPYDAERHTARKRARAQEPCVPRRRGDDHEDGSRGGQARRERTSAKRDVPAGRIVPERMARLEQYRDKRLQNRRGQGRRRGDQAQEQGAAPAEGLQACASTPGPVRHRMAEASGPHTSPYRHRHAHDTCRGAAGMATSPGWCARAVKSRRVEHWRAQP